MIRIVCPLCNDAYVALPKHMERMHSEEMAQRKRNPDDRVVRALRSLPNTYKVGDLVRITGYGGETGCVYELWSRAILVRLSGGLVPMHPIDCALILEGT